MCKTENINLQTVLELPFGEIVQEKLFKLMKELLSAGNVKDDSNINSSPTAMSSTALE